MLWREIRPKGTLPQCIIVGPTFTFKGEIMDAEMGQPVTATVRVNDIVIHREVTEFSVTFPQNLDQFLIIAVEAPGYERWALGIRPHGATARTMSGPIRLKKIQPR